jgi:hypothetical protein
MRFANIFIWLIIPFHLYNKAATGNRWLLEYLPAADAALAYLIISVT